MKLIGTTPPTLPENLSFDAWLSLGRKLSHVEP